jgi:FixJ family two-component response regulator
MFRCGRAQGNPGGRASANRQRQGGRQNKKTREQPMPASVLVSVVDDDESVREALPDLLREFGFAAEAFASADAFLRAGALDETKCLILDIAMPGMTGPELKKILDSRGLRIPVIFITANANAAREQALSGAAACLVKPFSDTALLDALKMALKM